MRKNDWFAISKNLVYLTQVGLSVASPIVLLLLGASWLQRQYAFGAWVYLVAIVLGLGAGTAAFIDFIRTFLRKMNRK
ncbi:MAG: AtpZ/AtpI family protein [Oscillospiraceae bacterium]|nr:AtpZ/AtpI family protein [Oscillospiraceae bacterium]